MTSPPRPILRRDWLRLNTAALATMPSLRVRASSNDHGLAVEVGQATQRGRNVLWDHEGR